MNQQSIIATVSTELGLAPRQVASTLALFDEGATLPFIARYRKEATGGLDEVQLRDVRDRTAYLRELEERRAAVLKSIEDQGKLDDALRARIHAAPTKQALEDLYLPYKPKRRTRATIAKERGLEPLADAIWGGEHDDAGARSAAAQFIDADRDVPDADAALQGARDILAERVAEDAALRGFVRDATHAQGIVASRVRPEKSGTVTKFSDYYEFSQKLTEIPSHRMLAVRRGEAEEVLTWTIEAPVEQIVAGLEQRVLNGRRAVATLRAVVADAYKRLLAPSIEVDLRLELKSRADDDAIGIFGGNLEQLLLAAPAGERVVLGLDPGFRTGVKVVVASRTGAVLEINTIYLHQEQAFTREVVRMIDQHGVELIAIGNGTASRETETAVRRIVREKSGAASCPTSSAPQIVVVNEAGASVYSASDIARAELPDLDVSLRGAASIARRLQDPLAELVKIEPKSIGVGQYQHDVSQTKLKATLDEVVQICVNRVGVEVNTASAPLLSYVAGIGPTLAKNIIDLRDQRGGLTSRSELLEVPRLGAKAFEQAAGFLRVRGGRHPLDATAVHPERYALVERMAADLGVEVTELVANDALVDRIELARYVDDGAGIGMPTLTDILAELRRPGRDPRDAFEALQFREDVTALRDLLAGMVLEGVVTNVVAFGAFVDIGVHQDGLVHVSQLADRFIKDPNEAVKVGQKVRVTVVSVDLERNRVALTMKSAVNAETGRAGVRAEGQGRAGAKTGSVRAEAKQQRSGARAAQKKAVEATAPAPKPGTIAPNGMRFS
ncbi:MAG: Tex family protein [Longimicrobiales bacterium]